MADDFPRFSASYFKAYIARNVLNSSALVKYRLIDQINVRKSRKENKHFGHSSTLKFHKQ